MQIPTFVPSLYDDALPGHQIITMLGLDYFHRLQAALGGQEVKVPLRADRLGEEHLLVRSLGRDDARKLCETMGGELFYVPRGTRAHPQASAVAREVAAGQGTQAIAAKLGLSARHVRRLKARVANVALPSIAAE